MKKPYEKPEVIKRLKIGSVVAQFVSSPKTVSDIRLKQNIHHVETLDNGINLYSYQYKGDKRNFLGVIAQELVDSPEYSSAASRGKNGFYKVDYGKLGIEVNGHHEMISAGENAVKLVSGLN